MVRVLAYSIPGKGHLFPLIPVLTELRARGHAVTLLTGAGDIAATEGLGFDVHAVDPAIEQVPLDDWKTHNPRKALRLSVQAMAERAQHDSVDLTRAIECFAPDIVIVDANAWGAVCAAEAWGGPWALFVPYPLPISSRDAPPFGPGLRPATGPLGRLRDRTLRPLVLGALEREVIPPLNTLRAEAGLEPVAGADEMFGTAPLVIATTSEPFEYSRSDWPDNVVLVGACDWDPPASAPPWLDVIERPIVLVTTSSLYQGDDVLVSTAISALAEEPVEVIATLPAADPDQFVLPANARVERQLPHGLVLDRAACMVTHGGMGSTQKALARGVPVCVVPFGRDQSEVARRVEVSGGGTRLPARRLSESRLRQKVQQAMAMGDGARRVADGFAAAGNGPAAADAIEQRLLGTAQNP
jgi:MGT family glycosyltransferase